MTDESTAECAKMLIVVARGTMGGDDLGAISALITATMTLASHHMGPCRAADALGRALDEAAAAERARAH